MSKIKVTEKKFLDWFFSDIDDKIILAHSAISELKATGKFVRTVQDILNECQYVPGFITEDGDESDEYSPEDVELINDRVPQECYKCHTVLDGSMGDYCPNCLACNN